MQDWGYTVYWSFSYTAALSEAQGLSIKKLLQKLIYLGFEKKKLCMALAAKLSKAAIQWHNIENILKNQFQECYERFFYKPHIYNVNIFHVCLCLDYTVSWLKSTNWL